MQAQISQHRGPVGTAEVMRIARMSYPYQEYARLVGVDYGTVLSAADYLVGVMRAPYDLVMPPESDPEHAERFVSAMRAFQGELRTDLEDLVVQVERENARGLPR